MSKEIEDLKIWSKKLLSENRHKILMEIRKDIHKIAFIKLEKYDWEKTKYFIKKRMEFFLDQQNTLHRITYSELKLFKEKMIEIETSNQTRIT